MRNDFSASTDDGTLGRTAFSSGASSMSYQLLPPQSFGYGSIGRDGWLARVPEPSTSSLGPYSGLGQRSSRCEDVFDTGDREFHIVFNAFTSSLNDLGDSVRDWVSEQLSVMSAWFTGAKDATSSTIASKESQDMPRESGGDPGYHRSSEDKPGHEQQALQVGGQEQKDDRTVHDTAGLPMVGPGGVTAGLGETPHAQSYPPL